MGEKGSLKNLYKSFRFFLANQKKKQKEKLSKKKPAKANIKINQKVKLSFFVVLTAIFGFFGSFLSFTKKEDEEIKEINNLDDLSKVKTIVVNIVNTIEKTNSIENINKCKTKLTNIEKVITNTFLVSTQVEVLKKEVKTANTKAEEKIDIIKTKEETVKKIEIIKQEKIEKVNKELKETKEKVNEIKNKLPEVVSKDQLFDLKKEVEKLEEKFKKNELKEEDIKKLDQFLLLYNTEEIRMLKTKIDDKLKKVVADEIKEETIIPIVVGVSASEVIDKPKEIIEETKEENKEVNKKEQVKEKDNKEEEEKKDIPESSISLDIKMTTAIISKQIIGMENRVNEARRVINNKPFFFIRIRSMVSNTLRLCASISPFFFFKNKVVGTFTSAILLDNSIRGLRRSISDNKRNVSYIRTNGLELLLKEHKEIEQRTKETFDDSLEQLTFFKMDFINKYGMHINNNIELKNMMNEICDIEEYIMSKQDEYKKQNERIKIKLKRY